MRPNEKITAVNTIVADKLVNRGRILRMILFCCKSAKTAKTAILNRAASISAGLRGEAETVVHSNRNTARIMKSGNLEVFATPSMIALMEEAACAALQSSLDAGETTVSKTVTVKCFLFPLSGSCSVTRYGNWSNTRKALRCPFVASSVRLQTHG